MNARNSSAPPGRRQAEDGFVVVAVLWILAALATLASVYSVYVVNTAAMFSLQDDRLQAGELVSSAVELTVYQMTANPEFRLPRGSFTFRLGRANVAVEFRSESGRIDLNVAPKEVLSSLFRVLGVRSDNAETYADRIVGWREPPSEGDDKEASLYRAAGLRYAPRGGKFPHVGELSLVLGLPPFLVERALPYLTVNSGSEQVNAMDASPDVLAVLPGMTPDRLHAVLIQRQAEPNNAQAVATLLGQGSTSAGVEGGKTTRVSVGIVFDNGRRTSSEVVILPLEEGPEPYSVLSWRDDIDEPAADERPRSGS